MTDYVLEIKLLSPLTSAAGEGRIGVVDRDIVFDDLGLPILPGRRLKGLWREAYRDVADAWQQCGEGKTPAENIFGYPGRRHGDGGACIHIGNAELKEASSLKDWLAYLQHHKNQRILSDDVVQHYATVRAQTSIDRNTGAAKENTLRLTRTLKAGRVFWAPVYFGTTDQTLTPNQALINALALGAAALQHMGTARTRGLGKIRCRLLKWDSGNLIDLTPDLNQSSLPIITGAGFTQSNQNSPVQTGGVTFSDTHILRYRLTLTEPAVIPVADSDPNTVVTRQDIPGSHLWGAAAWHYLHQDNHAPSDAAFRQAFLDGGLRFLAAYPEAADALQRLIPTPHSIRKFKDQDNDNTIELIDFVEQNPGKRPTKRIERHYARMSQGVLYTQAVKMERNYHHARVAKDRSVGRALGAEVPDGGALFTYEAIQASQTFQGAVLGSANDLNNLKTWLQNLNIVSIGRSRSAQYGKANFEWIDSVPQKSDGLVEWNGFASQQAPTNLEKSLIITTLSPLLAVNDSGHLEARFPICELADALKLNISERTLSASYTRTEMVSGYNSHLRLPRQQCEAIAAGSVFVFKLEDNPDQNDLLQLEQNGLGLRKNEGYGRVAVNRQGNFNNRQQISEEQLDHPDKATLPQTPESEIHSDLQILLRNIIRKRCMTEMQGIAVNLARRIKNDPSNSLIGRLRLFLKQSRITAITHLDNLRKPAEDSLKKCQINTRGYPNTLYDLFRKTLENPSEMTDTPIETQAKNLLKDGETDNTRQALIEQLQRDDSEEMVKVFLNHLLTALYRK